MLGTSENRPLVPESIESNYFLFPKKKLKILLLLIVAIVLLYLYNQPLKFVDFDETTEEELHIENKTFNILYWTHFFNHHNWYAEEDGTLGEATLKAVNCPVTNCYFTHDKKYLNNITDFDAIMFHGPEPSDYAGNRAINRKPNQLYIFVTLEAPTKIFDDLKPYKNFYNLTMTYRMDSDIPWYYGLVTENDKIIAPSKDPKWKQPENEFYDESLIKLYKNKTKSIAWFASNCNADNHRQNLVQEMRKHIDVDIFGGCGESKCKGQECDDLLTYTYKFYLSFENSLCKDYVSEKLYRALSKYNIPIVFNGADMTPYAPPKSFINVQDFENVEEFTKYLRFLMDKPEEYIKYFWWKKHYGIKTHPVFRNIFCNLCQKLNDDDFMSQKHEYADINAWTRDNQCNQTARIKF